MIPVRLRIEVQGSSKQAVLDKLYYQAGHFFKGEEFHLDGDILVGVDEITDVAGQTVSTTWVGQADFVNWRDFDQLSGDWLTGAEGRR